MSRERHLVLDLDSTLVHTSEEMKQIFLTLNLYNDPHHAAMRGRIEGFSIYDVFDEPGTGNELRMWTCLRPHLREFLDFAHRYFTKIFIWSAGQHKYVHAIVDLLFPSYYPRPPVIFTWKNCVINGRTILKPLANLYTQLKAYNADPTNTFCVDDRADTFANNFDNAIHIPVYEPMTLEDVMAPDPTLLQLRDWLCRPEVVEADDIRTLDKSKIFQ